jgi:hypothetical protein
MTVLRRAHRRLPPWAQGLLKPALFAAGLPRRQELVLLEGAERSGGKPLSVVFAGPADARAALIRRAYGDDAATIPLGTVPLWLSSQAIAERAPWADLVVRRVPAAYECLPRPGVLARLPAWVPRRIDLDDPACESRGREKIARMRNKARRSGFAFATAAGEAAFRDFYDRLHAPYVKERHGDGASVQTREETLARLRSGAWTLLTARLGGETAAAGTVEFDGREARFWQLGVRDGSRALLEAGAADAVYSYVLEEARARGCASLHLGHSRPFGRDGVLEYKRMLGAYVLDARDERRGCLDLSVRRLTAGAADFLTENPLIALDDDGRLRLYGFVRGGAGEARERAQWWRTRYCFKGTMGLRVYAAEGPAPREVTDRLP